MSSQNETARIEAFSDGVYAIAITLLVLTIAVPSAASVHSVSDLWKELGSLWPSFFAFTLSFGFILISWVNHHNTFKLVDHSAPAFLYANGFLLLNVVLMPFPTALLAEYITTDYIQPAVVLYCFSGLLQSVSWGLLLFTIEKFHLLKNHPVAVTEIKKGDRFFVIGLTVRLITTILAWWLPLIALILSALLWLLWISLGLRAKKIESLS